MDKVKVDYGMELGIGDWVGMRVKGTWRDDDAVYSPHKVVKVNAKSVKLDNDDLIMAPYGNVRGKRGASYEQLPSSKTVEEHQAAYDAWLAVKKETARIEQEKRAEERRERQRQTTEKFNTLMELNKDALLKPQTIVDATGVALNAYNLINAKGEFIMMIVSPAKIEKDIRHIYNTETDNSEWKEVETYKIEYVTYGQPSTWDRGFRNSYSSGLTINEAIIGAIM